MSFFSRQAIGFDIADHTIEVAELVKIGGRIKVAGLARIKLEPGVVVCGRVKDKQKLAQSIKEVLAQAKPKPIAGKKIIFGLPERQVYTHVITLSDLGKIDDQALELIIKEEINKTIPLAKDDLLYSYKILVKTKERVEALIVAASLEVVWEWQSFFQTLKLEVEFFDIETLAVFRDLFDKISEKPVCVVDIGAVNTNISIFNQTGLRYSGSVEIAGDKLTQIFVQQAKKKENNLAVAEETKIKFDLAKTKDKKTAVALTEVLDQILQEIKATFSYFQEQTGSSVQAVVLVGGSSQLSGLVEYFKSQLGLEVRLGASRLLQSQVPLVYVEAIGLCLKALNKKQYKQDPVFLIKPVKLKTKPKNEEASFKVTEEDELAIVADRTQGEDKTRSRLITLVIILVIGALAIGLSLWYKSGVK